MFVISALLGSGQHFLFLLRLLLFLFLLLLTSVQQGAALTSWPLVSRLRQHEPQLHGGSDLLRLLRTFRHPAKRGDSQPGGQVHAGVHEEPGRLPGGEERPQGEPRPTPCPAGGVVFAIDLLFWLPPACPPLSSPPRGSAVSPSTWRPWSQVSCSSSWCRWFCSSSRRAGPSRKPSTTALSPSAPSASGTLWQVQLVSALDQR